MLTRPIVCSLTIANTITNLSRRMFTASRVALLFCHVSPDSVLGNNALFEDDRFWCFLCTDTNCGRVLSRKFERSAENVKK